MKSFLALVLFLNGCVTYTMPDGSQLEVFGDGSFEVFQGEFDANGKCLNTCYKVTVKGGRFSGWEPIAGIAGVALSAATFATK